MKRKLFFFLTLMTLASMSYAHNFSAKCSTGQWLYYTIISGNNVAVTYPGSYPSQYRYYTKPSGDLVIPSSVSYDGTVYSVTSIGANAFYTCTGLTSVTIPNSVTSIGAFAFEDCTGLTSVTIPNSVTSIGDNAFIGCSGLIGTLIIPNSVTIIGGCAFSGCSGLTSVTIPNSVTSIGYGTFNDCSGLTSVTIPNSVTSIGNLAFEDCSGLTSVTIPDMVTSIGSSAFKNCSGLNSVTIPNSVTSIGACAFYGCSGLTSVTIPNMVTIIGMEAFRDCSGLTSVTIPNSVTSIGDYAFYNSGLTSVTIPNSVTSIGDYAFYNSGLTSVRIHSSNPPTLGRYAFSRTPAGMVIEIPCGSLTAYQQAWGTNYNYSEVRPSYTITLHSNNNDWGTTVINQQDGHDISCDSTAIVAATASNGYHFTQWNDGNTDNPRTVTVTADVTYTALFAIDNYSISASSNDDSMGSVSGSGIYVFGTTVTLTAVAAPCHHFVAWSNGATTEGISFTASGNDTLTATFARDADQHSHEYVTHCGPYMWAVNGRTYNQSGMKTFKSTSAEGCISRDTLELTIIKGFVNPTTEVISCVPYYWDVTGKTYNKSGVKTFKSQLDEHGCPTYDTLRLNIIKGHANPATEVTTCLPYYWDITGKTYNKSGVKTFKSAPDANGCPTYDTLRLNIIRGYTNYEYVENCGPYTWVTTGKTYNKSGVKTFKSVPDANGCPTYDTLELVILNCDGNNRPTTSSEGVSNLSPLASHLSLYPNPTSGRLQIDAAEVEKVEILDMVGRRVALFENTATIDLSSLADGTYTLRVTLPDGLAIRKVVKK